MVRYHRLERRIVNMYYQGIINYPRPKQEYKVLVRCFTYNQKTYIEDALNGFAMQQTDFPFVCLVMDDASTDGEEKVIKAWMERECDMSRAETIDIPTSVVIIVPHKTNAFCTFAVYILKQNLYKAQEAKFRYVTPWREKCEYEAMCEGDDYWIDPLKLQKQVDFLDEHLDKTLVYTDCNVCFHSENIVIKDALKTGYFKQTKGYKDFLLEGKYITPCSWLYRWHDYNSIILPSFTTDGTLCRALELLIHNRVGYINDTTCVYRVVHSGASHNKDLKIRYEYLKGVFKTEKYYLEKFSSYFNEEDTYLLYNKRYIDHIPFAVAFNDKEVLEEIKSFNICNINWKFKLILALSNISMVRKFVYKKLQKSIQYGL